MKKSLIIFFCFASIYLSKAQIIYNFGTLVPDVPTAAPTSGIPLTNGTITSLTTSNSFATIALIDATSPSTGAGSSGNYNAGTVSNYGPLVPSTSTYFEFTITPSTNYEVTVSNINFRSRRTSTGPVNLVLRTSLDGFTTDVATATSSAVSSWGLKTFSGLMINGTKDVPITFRIYGVDAVDGGTALPTSVANWRIDDLNITYITLLPVRFTKLTVAPNETQSNYLFKWEVEQNIEIKNFEIESSNNGTFFTSESKIIYNNSNSYSYATICNLNKYYRLKINYFNNSFDYSKIIKVASINPYISIHNISIHNTTISYKIESFKNTNATFQLINATGLRINQKKIQLVKGITQYNFTTPTLSKGMYFIKINTSEALIVKQLIIN